jgi:hypothetical protein
MPTRQAGYIAEFLYCTVQVQRVPVPNRPAEYAYRVYTMDMYRQYEAHVQALTCMCSIRIERCVGRIRSFDFILFLDFLFHCPSIRASRSASVPMRYLETTSRPLPFHSILFHPIRCFSFFFPFFFFSESPPHSIWLGPAFARICHRRRLSTPS